MPHLLVGGPSPTLVDHGSEAVSDDRSRSLVMC
jgi:hypothetical protein